MQSTLTPELVRQVATEELGAPSAVSAIPGSQHSVFRVSLPDGRQYVIKIHTGTNVLVGNAELAAYEHLQGAPAIRSVVARGVVQDHPYLILEYDEGRTLLQLLEAEPPGDSVRAAIAEQMVVFFRRCFAVDTLGFGLLDSRLHGTVESWSAHLGSFLAGTEARLEDLPASNTRSFLFDSCNALKAFLARESTHFARVKPVLVPVDLNLSNWLLTDSGRLMALDLGAFWGADALLALGEWAGHTYGTPLYSAVAHAWGALSESEELVIRFYALMSNLSVMLFLALRDSHTSLAERPWGHPLSFGELMLLHLTALTGR